MERTEPMAGEHAVATDSPGNRPRRFLASAPTATRTIALVVSVVCVSQALMGAVWWLAAAGTVPAYGDTVEYVAQSRSLAVDSYRTLTYPLLIRAATRVGAMTGIEWSTLLSIGQLAVSVLATWYVVRSLSPATARRWVTLVTAVAVTAPLPLHFTHAVLTDSLAASALLLLTAGLIRVAARDDRSVAAVAGVAAGTVGSLLLRPDRLYVCAVLGVVAAAVILVRARRRRLGRRVVVSGILISLVLVVAAAVATTAVNRLTQTADLGREPQSLTGAVFDRVAYRHLDEIRDRVPISVAAALPPPARPGDIPQPAGGALAALRAAGGDAYVRATIVATLRCCATVVAAETARDVALDAVGPYSVAADWVTGHNGSAQWNFSRMRETAPTATDVFMAWSVATTALLAPLTVAAVVLARRRRSSPPWRGAAAVVAAAPALALSALFGLVTSLDPNPRYTLTVQMLWWVVPLAFLPLDRADEALRDASSTSA